MQKYLLFGLASMMSWGLSMKAQEYVEAYVVPEVVALNVSSNGKFATLQDYFSNSATIDLQSKALTYYGGTYPGNGNCLTNSGLMVGQSILNSKAYIMFDGDNFTPQVLENITLSTLDAITPDGKRACGWVATPSGAIISVPFYIDLDENGEAEKINYLPFPKTDFLQEPPQFATAVWISDDGHTILGQVQDSSGFYTYPIVYVEDANGNWSYSLPSEDLFNPNHLEIPKYPEDGSNPPQITEFMTPDNSKKWRDDMVKYDEGEGPNPWNNINSYMTEAEYQRYIDAVNKYQNEVQNFYQKLDEYWEKMGEITKGSNFVLSALCLQPDGKKFASILGVNDDEEGMSDNFIGYQVVVFDVETKAMTRLNSAHNFLYPKQMLADGTVICLDMSTYCDYAWLPGSDEVITIKDFLKKVQPSWVQWMEEYLPVHVTTSNLNDPEIAAGYLSFSKDLSVMAGTAFGEEGFSYFFEGSAGVEDLTADFIDGRYVVYDIMGRKLLDTKNSEELQSLKAGLYIINGKKTLVK